MKQGALQIRAASVEDAAALLNIYAPYGKTDWTAYKNPAAG